MGPKPDARPPADDAQLLDGIRHFIADAADIAIETVDPDVNIYEALGVDSLGATCVFIDISYEYGIPEPEAETDFVELNTARKILGYVRAQETRLV
jgi:acyl carrier protein